MEGSENTPNKSGAFRKVLNLFKNNAASALTSETDQATSKTTTRETFLKASAGAGVIALTAVAALRQPSQEQDPLTKLPETPPASIEKASQNFSFIEKFILNREIHQEQQRYQWGVDSTGQKYLKDNNQMVKNMLKLEPIIEEIVSDPGLNIPEEHRQFWIDRTRQIILAETEANPNPNNPHYKGPMQLGPSLAAEIAGKFKRFRGKEYDIEDPRTNIFMGLAHQLNLSKRYGTEIGAWVHHLGSGNVEKAIGTFLKGVDLSDATNDIVLGLIIKNRINPVNLLGNLKAVMRLQSHEVNAFNDDTDRYYYRMFARDRTYQEEKQKLLTPQVLG